MKNYKVDIEFKKGPAFSTDVCAMSEQSARSAGQRIAEDCGFDAPVKQIKVTEQS